GSMTNVVGNLFTLTRILFPRSTARVHLPHRPLGPLRNPIGRAAHRRSATNSASLSGRLTKLTHDSGTATGHGSKLNRRLAGHATNPADVVAWQQVKAEALARCRAPTSTTRRPGTNNAEAGSMRRLPPRPSRTWISSPPNR